MVGITAVRYWTIIKRTMSNIELLDNFHKNNILFGVSSFLWNLGMILLTIILALNTSKVFLTLEILCNLTSVAMSFWKPSTYYENQHLSLSVYVALWKSVTKCKSTLQMYWSQSQYRGKQNKTWISSVGILSIQWYSFKWKEK